MNVLMLLASGCATEIGNPEFDFAALARTTQPDEVGLGEGQGITVEEALVTVREVRFDAVDEDCSDKVEQESDIEGPWTIDLVAGDALPVSLEARSFCRLRVRFDRAEGSELDDVSVRLTGRRSDDVPFVIASREKPDLELRARGAEAFTLSDDVQQLLLTFDVAQWLDFDLDALTPGADGTLRVDDDNNEDALDAFDDALEESLELFEDLDRGPRRRAGRHATGCSGVTVGPGTVYSGAWGAWGASRPSRVQGCTARCPATRRRACSFDGMLFADYALDNVEIDMRKFWWLGGLAWCLVGCELLEDLGDPDEDDPTGDVDVPQVVTDIPEFDIDAFVENLDEQFDDSHAGVQVVVSRDGNLHRSFAKGNATYDPDPEGDVAMTVDTRMSVASVSKFIATIALLQVLEEEGISLGQPVHSYLPEDWKSLVHSDHWEASSNFAFSFENLLRHETGLDFDGSGRMPEAATMLDVLGQPANPDRYGVYQNGNFALVRVLMCEISLGIEFAEEDYDRACADAYTAYLNENVFEPVGVVDPVGHLREDGDTARAHRFPFETTFQAPPPSLLGWLGNDSYPRNAGSAGLRLSAMDLAAVLAFFRFDTQQRLVSSTIRDDVLMGQLGLNNTVEGDHGLYYSKSGTNGPDNCCDRAFRAQIMMFPQKVDAVVLTNSFDVNLVTKMRDAFDDAWN